MAANITVHSCGGSRGFDRVPFLASANAEEPRKRKATHGIGAGQSLSFVPVENPCQLTSNPHPCSPTQLVTGALHRVKRETGESCALLKPMSVRCCPRNGKRAKHQIHCADTAWEGDACRSGPAPTPREPGDRPATHSTHTFCVAEHNKPAVGGRCSNPCVLTRRGFMRSTASLTFQREAPCRSSAAPAATRTKSPAPPP
jgi:hypothetical protein